MPIHDARYYKTLLVCPNRQFLTDLGPLLAHALPLAPVQDIPAYPSRRQIVDILKVFEAKLCLLDFSQAGDEPARVLEDLHAAAPGLPVVALLANHNADAILRCVRLGASDILIHPFTTDQIEAAIEKIVRMLPQERRGGGRLVGLIPAKGGAGTTTIACNLAYQCKRLGAQRIFLGDMDPLAGTVSFLLKLSTGYSFMDVLGRAPGLDADLWRQMVTTSQGVDVLLAPETPPDPATELPTASPILDYTQDNYQAAIFDCGSAYGAWHLSIAQRCDEILVVSTNELASLQAAQRTIAYLGRHNVDRSRLKFVLNRYVKDEGLNAENIADVLGLEPYHVIPNDPDAVQKSAMDGKPIAPNSAAGKSLASLANRLLSFAEAQVAKKPAPKSGLGRIFGR